MPTFDDAYGVRIHYYEWLIEKPKAVLQISHGIGEHALRYADFAKYLNSRGYSVYADDHRGHGATGLEQHGGDHSKLGHLGEGGLKATLEAVIQFTELIREKNPDIPLFIHGHSWGSLITQILLNTESDRYEGAILTGTAYRLPGSMDGGDLSRRHRPRDARGRRGGHGFEWMTRDEEIQNIAASDPLMVKAATIQLLGIRDTLRLIGRPSAGVRSSLPLLIAVGEDDILGGGPSALKLARAYRRRAGLTDVTTYIYPDARHEILNETNRVEVYSDLANWLDAHVGEPATA